ETGQKAPYTSDSSGRRIDTVKIVIDSVIKLKDTSKRVEVQRKVEMLRAVNNRAPSVMDNTVAAASRVSVIRVLKDSVITNEKEKPDAGSAENRRQALLGYSYFKKIQQGRSKDINVFVSIKFPASRIVDTLTKLSKPESGEFKNDTATVATEIFEDNLADCDSVDVTLTDPSAAFKIDSFGLTRQPIAALSRWTWAVTPLTNLKKANLILNATPRRKDGSPKTIDPKVIIIEIEIVPGFFRNLWIYINDNPWTIMTVIIIPLAVFLGKRLFKTQKT
ncbi:MAG TPA: hypothetical protein VK772_18200, partial [Puia sp.]|nr:hypothetical protein [Puia sp.]